jgi:5-methyltetrahydropteroyltriglutamate--homocysteine methyltransferase
MSLIAHLKDKEVMVGAVAVTPDRVESPEEVAATIKEAMQYVDAERILPCTNCGMAPIPYDVAAGKLKALAAGAELARQSI